MRSITASHRHLFEPASPSALQKAARSFSVRIPAGADARGTRTSYCPFSVTHQLPGKRREQPCANNAAWRPHIRTRRAAPFQRLLPPSAPRSLPHVSGSVSAIHSLCCLELSVQFLKSPVSPCYGGLICSSLFTRSAKSRAHLRIINRLLRMSCHFVSLIRHLRSSQRLSTIPTQVSMAVSRHRLPSERQRFVSAAKLSRPASLEAEGQADHDACSDLFPFDRPNTLVGTIPLLQPYVLPTPHFHVADHPASQSHQSLSFHLKFHSARVNFTRLPLSH